MVVNRAAQMLPKSKAILVRAPVAMSVAGVPVLARCAASSSYMTLAAIPGIAVAVGSGSMVPSSPLIPCTSGQILGTRSNGRSAPRTT